MVSKTKSTEKENQPKSQDLKKSISKLKKMQKALSDEKDEARKKAKKLKNKKGKKSKLKKLKEFLAKLLKKEKKVSSKLKALKKERKKVIKPNEHKAVKKTEEKVIIEKKEDLNEVLEAQSSPEHADSIIVKQDQPLNHSSIDHNVKEAVKHIRTLTDLQDIDIYVLGDKRITVQKAADARKNSLPKSQ